MRRALPIILLLCAVVVCVVVLRTVALAQDRPTGPPGGARIQSRVLPLPFDDISGVTLSPDGRMVALTVLDAADHTQIHVVPADGGDPTALTTGTSNNRAPRFSSDSRQIAFVSERSGNADIWSVPASGGAPKQITNDPGDDLDPEWSPDAKHVVFASNRAGATLLYLVSASGGQVYPLSAGTGPDRRPAWSPDGEWIVFESGREGLSHAFVIGSGGGEARRLGTRVEPEWIPSWSADSRRVRTFSSLAKQLTRVEYPLEEGRGEPVIAKTGLMSDPTIAVPSLSLAGDRLVSLKPGGAGIGILSFEKQGGGRSVLESSGITRDPTWAPDGRRLVFVSDREGRRDLFIVGVSSGRVSRLTNTEARESTPCWSSLGGDIAYSLESPTGSSIWVLEPETERTLKVVSEPGRNSEPAWSPDDKMLAYVSDREGSPDIWIAQIGDGKTRRLTTMSGVESHPTWSPDGKFIAFASDAGGAPQIWKVPVEAGGEPVRVSVPDDAGSARQEPSWNGKNTWIALTLVKEGATSIQVVPPKGGKPFPSLLPQGMRVGSPAWSPDSSHIAYEWSRKDQVVVLEISGS